jgi:hypothetical protein
LGETKETMPVEDQELQENRKTIIEGKNKKT